MTLQWYAVMLCRSCASGETGECHAVGCARWMMQAGIDCHSVTELSLREESTVRERYLARANTRWIAPISNDQLAALEAARDFDGGLQS